MLAVFRHIETDLLGQIEDVGRDATEKTRSEDFCGDLCWEAARVLEEDEEVRVRYIAQYEAEMIGARARGLL